jgi:peptidyl-prolyl cis-trans isomerase SurA
MYLKRILACLLYIYFTLLSVAYCLENKILAKIDKEIITSIDVEREAKYLLSLNKSINNLSKEEIFLISKKSIIREKVKYIEIKKQLKNPNMPEEYVEQILKSIYQRIGIENLENFKKYLKKNNIDYEFVKKKIEIESLWNELIIHKFSPKIIIDEEKIRQILINNNTNYSKSFSLSEIFFETSNYDQIRSSYNKIVKTIKNEGFDKAVLTYSSSNTSSSGGKLGWIKEETLNENLKNIFSKMKEGEFTNPITVPGGFLILKINQIKEEKTNQNIEEKIKEIIDVKKNDQLNQFSKIYFNKIKKNIQINEF